MKLTIHFESVSDLKKQMLEIMEAFEPVQQLSFPLEVTAPVKTETQTPCVLNQDAVDVVVAQEKPKRGRKAKAQPEPEPVVKQEDIEEVPTEVPSNFYSFTEFQTNFVNILGNLLKSMQLTHADIESYTTKFQVPFIYAISKDLVKMEDFYNDLVAKKIITKKGDY